MAWQAWHSKLFMTENPPIVQQRTNANYRPPIVQQPVSYNPNQFAQPGYGQQPPNMGYGYGQPQFRPPAPVLLAPQPPVPGVPIGLEPLLPLGHIFVKQQIELFEALTGYETANRYDVLAGNGQRIFFAAETTSPACLACGGSNRPFTIDIIDFFGRRVMNLNRVDGVFDSGGEMVINLGDGNYFGRVTQLNCCSAEFDVSDATGVPVMMITGPAGADCCTRAADYPITTKAGQPLGIIRKTFAGFAQEYFTDADNFGVEFPPALDVRWKALMFAAVFLIDFLYYEATAQGHHHHHHTRVHF